MLRYALFGRVLLGALFLAGVLGRGIGGLLLGSWRYGWRGVRAVHWTLTAMALLLLSFFGSKFVLELVQGRP